MDAATRPHWPKSGATAGIVSAVLLIISFFVFGEPPAVDASGDELAAFLVDQRTAGLIAVLLGAIAVPLFGVFASGMRKRFEQSVGAELAGMAAVSGMLYWLINVTTTAVFFGASWIDGDAHAATPEVAQTLWSSANALLAMSSPLAALYLAVAAAAGLRGALPKWLGWATAVIAAIALLGVLGVVAPDLTAFTFFASVLFALWMILTNALTFSQRTQEP